MAYIDTKYIGECETCRHHKSGKCDTWCDGGESYQPDMTKIPTADVVEIVRCRDCKHCWHLVPDYTYPDRTDDVWECVRTIDYVEPDHFCRRGERRTE